MADSLMREGGSLHFEQENKVPGTLDLPGNLDKVRVGLLFVILAGKIGSYNFALKQVELKLVIDIAVKSLPGLWTGPLDGTRLPPPANG